MPRPALRLLLPLVLATVAALSLAGVDANLALPHGGVAAGSTVAVDDAPSAGADRAPAIVHLDTTHLRPAGTHSPPAVVAVLAAALGWAVLVARSVVTRSRSQIVRPVSLHVRLRGPPTLRVA